MSKLEGVLNAPPKTQEEWRKALDDLPSTPDNIPAFFFAHGSPILAFPESLTKEGVRNPMVEYGGPKGPLATFLRDFGPKLLQKYKPKAIVVFSAHWETLGERLGMSATWFLTNLYSYFRVSVTDYGEENPLLMDYYNFQPELYQLKFKSRGDTTLSHRIVDLYKLVTIDMHFNSSLDNCLILVDSRQVKMPGSL